MNDQSSTRTAAPVLVERINLLRGLAIVGVIAIHTSGHFGWVAGTPPVVTVTVVTDVLTHFAVPLFVLLSGLTLARRYAGGPVQTRRFYERRLTKVVPPYVVFSLLYLLLSAVDFGYRPATSWVIIATATGNAYYHLWFVAMLVQLYLLFPLLLMLVQRAGAYRNALLLAAFILQVAWNAGSPLLAAALPQRPLFETLLSNRVFLSHIFYFLLGMIAGLDLNRFDARARSLPRGPLALAVVVTAGATSALWLEGMHRYGSLKDTPAAFLTSSVLMEPLLYLATIVLLWQLTPWLQGRPQRLKTALAWLGIASFPIYLVHVFFQWLLLRGLAPLGLTPAAWLFYPIMYIATLVLSSGTAWALAQMPLGDYLAGAPRSRTDP